MSEVKQPMSVRLEKRRARRKQRRGVPGFEDDPTEEHPEHQPLESSSDPSDFCNPPVVDQNSFFVGPSSINPNLKLNLVQHQKQVMSAIQASTERRNRATGLVKNHMYYEENGPLSELTNMPQTGFGFEEPSIVKAGKFKKKRKREVFQEEAGSMAESQIEEKPETANPVLMEDNDDKDKPQEESKPVQYPSIFQQTKQEEDSKPLQEQQPAEQQQTKSDKTGGQELQGQVQSSPVETEPSLQDMTEQILKNKSMFNFESRKNFMIHPLPGTETLKCYIQRFKENFKTGFKLITDSGTVMMESQSKAGSVGCNYYISLTNEMTKSSGGYLGKLRSNFMGSQYMLYDNGDKTAKPTPKSRMTLANVQYENNFMGLKGPRKLHIRIADISKDPNMFRLEENGSLLQLSAKSPGSVYLYKNKQPKWNSRISSYSLNFGGRVKMASIKNFIIQNPTDSNKNLFVFGKVDEHTFSLEFANPFSPLQAFGIAISCFDFKLNCE